jgi:signal transduction histidine kinase/ActR/RegA family two-component response regulator
LTDHRLALRQAFDAERAARDAAERSQRRLELLAEAGKLLANSLEPRTTLGAIARAMVPSIADWCRVDLYDENGVMQRALTDHSDPEKSRYGTELTLRLKAAPGAVGSMAWVAETGRPYLAHFDSPGEHDPVRDRDLLTFARAIGMRAYYMVPLIARGRTLGTLAALQAESGRPLNPDDCALIGELAQRAALAIDNARLYARAEAALKEAQSANRAKDEFLAMLGHELRNPLAPIVTALKLMELRDGGAASDERRIIERQVGHLSRLVDDLLDVSRITQGKIQLEQAPVDVAAVVARALELTQPVFERRARPIEVALPPHPLTVRGDAVRLTQVLCNLLTNAAKFTPADGRIAVAVRETNGQAEIRVEDAGRGISPELLPRVFELFVQGPQTSDRQAGGLGLGLTIVRMLVQMHGGSVEARSDGPDRGASFTVRLPLSAATEQADTQPAARPPMAGTGGRVLVVDDNADAAETLARLLALVGWEARTAADGAQALHAVEAFAPDVAFLDIGLPGMDGYELARRLRGHANARSTLIVALTGYGRDPDRARALAAGFDEHLVKPVAAERLFELLEQRARLNASLGPAD